MVFVSIFFEEAMRMNETDRKFLAFAAGSLAGLVSCFMMLLYVYFYIF